MTDHTPFFDLIGRDVSALLGIAEYIDVCGRNRVARDEKPGQIYLSGL